MARTTIKVSAKVANKKLKAAEAAEPKQKKQKTEKSEKVAKASKPEKVSKKSKNPVAVEKVIEKKKHRFKPGTVALREMRAQQKSIEPALPRAPFSRLVRELINEHSEGDMRLGKNSVDALRYAAEEFMVQTFKRAQYLAVQCPGNENNIGITLRVPLLQAANHWMMETMNGLSDIGIMNMSRGASEAVVRHARKQREPKKRVIKPKAAVDPKEAAEEKAVEKADEVMNESEIELDEVVEEEASKSV